MKSGTLWGGDGLISSFRRGLFSKAKSSKSNTVERLEQKSGS